MVKQMMEQCDILIFLVMPVAKGFAHGRGIDFIQSDLLSCFIQYFIIRNLKVFKLNNTYSHVILKIIHEYFPMEESVMRIERLRVKNFRCFENLEIQLHPKCNVLVGINGAGKSTILDALAIALGGYLTGFDGIRSNSILPEDAHYKMFCVGSRIESQEQFPVEIYAEGTVEEKNVILNSLEAIISWQRELNGKDRRTTHGNVKFIADYARALQNRVRSGDVSCILPLVAYYGTGRLWLQKRNRTKYKKGEKLNRQMGYVDCIAAESNEKQMMQWFEEMTYIQLQEGTVIAELEAVKKALCKCYLNVDSSVTDVKFAYDVRSHELEIYVYRHNEAEKFPVRMLSDGEKGIISLAADIAYRMALLNPNLLDKVLETPGVVLIDEIDLHLHPSWQKKIMGNLMNIFPNIQFIVTTHSPSILLNVPRENIWILNHREIYQPQDMTYGRTVEEILREVMDTNVQPDEVVGMQKEFDQAVDNGDYDSAKKILDKMKNIMGENANGIIENQIVLDVEQ